MAICEIKNKFLRRTALIGFMFIFPIFFIYGAWLGVMEIYVCIKDAVKDVW
jgi:hypothetical protein